MARNLRGVQCEGRDAVPPGRYLVGAAVVRQAACVLLVEVEAVLHEELERERLHRVRLRAEQQQVEGVHRVGGGRGREVVRPRCGRRGVAQPRCGGRGIGRPRGDGRVVGRPQGDGRVIGRPRGDGRVVGRPRGGGRGAREA